MTTVDGEFSPDERLIIWLFETALKSVYVPSPADA